jgi:hypothetical protein
MKPTKQLIRALRETAHKLRNGADYLWADTGRCNCGLLAQTLLQMDGTTLNRSVPWGSWTLGAEAWFCSATGLPTHRIFKALSEAGLEPTDYARIEHLRVGKRSCPAYYLPHSVAAWMDREADELERRRIAERVVKEAK